MSKRDPDEFKITDPAEMLVGVVPPINVHPGVFFRETIMPEYGLKVAPLARAIGMDRASLHDVLQGRGSVSRDLAYKLGALLSDAVADLLIAHQLEYDLAKEKEKREAYKRQIERIAPVQRSAEA